MSNKQIEPNDSLRCELPFSAASGVISPGELHAMVRTETLLILKKCHGDQRTALGHLLEMLEKKGIISTTELKRINAILDHFYLNVANDSAA